MPNFPEPFTLVNWRERARAYDQFVFDFDASGEFLPLAWPDELRINIDRPTFGLPSHVGASDQVALNWGPKTDLGLYGSSYVGMLGALIRPTNEPYILQLDCLATDFFRDRAYPTFGGR
jgi:hypothetical protein